MKRSARWTMLWMFVGGTLSAQTPPQATTVDPKRLLMGKTVYNSYLIVDKDTMPTGSVTDVLSLQGSQLRRTYVEVDSVMGPHTDTITVNAATLRPVSLRSHSIAGVVSFDVKGDSVIGWRRESGADSAMKPIRRSVKGLFYDGWSFDLLVRSTDLRAGFQIVFPIMRDDPATVINMTGSVAGTGTVNGVECWVVAAKFDAMPVLFWISKKTRALLKQVIEPVLGYKQMMVAVP